MEMIQAKNVHISLPVGCHVHLDGEPIALQQYVDIQLCHQKLKIIGMFCAQK
jgi:diacylglycerol kinase family enzyme